MRAIDVVRVYARRAKLAYMEAFDRGDTVLAEYGITTPLRLAHFLAQVMHETDGLTIERESGAYSASRLLQIFGVGKHSAGITAAEAKRLAKNGPAIFERVYGLGNPRKARELGNTQPGDGWKYRGNGIMQTTGRGNHRRMGEKCGLGDLFERDPDAVTAAEYALLPALAEWKESGCNALADKNDIASITKRINGGYNGFDDRKAWFAKIYPAVKGEKIGILDKLMGHNGGPAWEDADVDDDIIVVQKQLNALGYGLTQDGRKGPATEKAIKDFQAKNGLRVDGIAGTLTRDKMQANINALKGNSDKAADPLPNGSAIQSGTVQGGAAAAAGGATAIAVAVDAAKDVGQVAADAKDQWSSGDILGIVLGVVIFAGGVYLIWSRLRDAGKLPRWLGGAS